MSEQPKSAARELATRLATLLAEFLAGRAQPVEVAAKLRRLADWIDRGKDESAEAAKEEKRKKTNSACEEIFQFWRESSKRSLSNKLTAERRRHIEARLRDGYTVEQIKQAIRAVVASPFHAGDNDRNQRYDDIIVICRNSTKLEQYIEMGVDAPVAESPTQSAELERLRQDAAKALREGRLTDYDEINKRARGIKSA